jgi:hypothetical protein
MSDHGDDEALSAFVDGEAPGWAAHVAGCGTCRARVEALRAVRAAVAAPLEPSPAGQRETAIAAALAAAAPRSRPSARGRPARWMVPASIAAVLLLVVAAASVLVQGGRDRTTTAAQAPATAAQAPESAAQAPVAGPGSAPSSGAQGGSSAGLSGPSTAQSGSSTAQSGSSTAGGSSGPATATDSAGTGDLGEVADAATLLARARPALAAAAKGSATPTLSPDPASVAPAAPSVVGTRPCEEQARAADPALREVVYFATAAHQGAPAVVLGFSTGPAPAPVTLLMLSRDGCGVLLRAAGP